ncbi:MAG: hypothetical protein ATN31_05230 [Candidatus Epulonipiscioides saccharophilum]|nr:MAG: hypothetical protein ATN31_05230 [Epulopiscium sp. AS2M-Bin001]
MELLRPTMDFIFKEIFGDEKNKDLLIDFLNAVLKYKTPIINLECLNTVKEYIEDKHSILDINVILSNGVKVNVEIHIRDKYDIRKRSLYYWGKNYSVDLKQGEWISDLTGAVCINILTTKIFDDEHIHHKFTLYDEEHKINYEKQNEILEELHFIELSKLDFRNINKTNDSQELINWLIFIDNPDLAKTKELGSTIDKALDVLTELSEDEIMRNTYFARFRMFLEENSALNKARQEGIKEGIKEGKKKIEIAIALLDVLGDEVIALKTGLDIEIVQNLRKVNNSKQG